MNDSKYLQSHQNYATNSIHLDKTGCPVSNSASESMKTNITFVTIITYSYVINYNNAYNPQFNISYT